MSITNDGEWLSDKIRSPCFDIGMNGNVRKSVEAEAFYTCVVICGTIKDDIFKIELDNVTKQYDFENMSSIIESGKNYITLLETWQSLQSYKVNVIISACKFSIANQKKILIFS